MCRQVGEVDSIFQALRAEVEALFMTGPSVSLEAVSTELQKTHAHVANEVGPTLYQPVSKHRPLSRHISGYTGPMPLRLSTPPCAALLYMLERML